MVCDISPFPCAQERWLLFIYGIIYMRVHTTQGMAFLFPLWNRSPCRKKKARRRRWGSCMLRSFLRIATCSCESDTTISLDVELLLKKTKTKQTNKNCIAQWALLWCSVITRNSFKKRISPAIVSAGRHDLRESFLCEYLVCRINYEEALPA